LPGLRVHLRWLEYHRAVLAGSYAEAADDLEAMLGRDVGLDPLLAELARQKIEPTTKFHDFNTVWPRMAGFGVGWPAFNMLAADSPLGVIAGHYGGFGAFQHFARTANARSEIATRIVADADFFFRRGFLALVAGDIPAARAR